MEVPVQLHLSDDNRFMSDLLARDMTHTGQVTDSEDSINDSDCEPLINSPLSKACIQVALCQMKKLGHIRLRLTVILSASK